MTIKRYDFEGGTIAAAIAAGQTGSGDPLSAVDASTGTLVYDTAHAAHGTKAAKVNYAAGAAWCRLQYTGLNTSTLAVRFYVYYESAPTQPRPFLRVADTADSRAVSIQTDAAGKLNINLKGTFANYVSPTAMPLNQWVRVEVYMTVGTTTTTGTLKCAAYAADSTTPIWTEYTGTGINTGTVNIGNIQFGMTGTSTGAETFWMDDLAYDDAGSTYIGPVPVSTTTVTPTSVVDNSGAFTNQGGAASLQAALADASDATYIESPTAPANKAITVAVGTLASGAAYVPVRARLAPSGGPATTCKIELLQGATVIATSTQAVTDTWADYVLTLTPTENAAITDRTALRVRLTANQP